MHQIRQMIGRMVERVVHVKAGISEIMESTKNEFVS